MHRLSHASPPNLTSFKTNQNEKFIPPRSLELPFSDIKSAFQPTNLKKQDFENFPNLGTLRRLSQLSPPNLANLKTTHNEKFLATRFLEESFGDTKNAFQPLNLKNQIF